VVLDTVENKDLNGSNCGIIAGGGTDGLSVAQIVERLAGIVLQISTGEDPTMNRLLIEANFPHSRRRFCSV
jgi:hypothetical protein